MNDIHKITVQATSDNYNSQVISSFLIEEEKILVLFYVKNCDVYANYSRIYYNYEDNGLNRINEESGFDGYDPLGLESYFKGLYLKNKYSAFIYYDNAGDVKLNISILRYNSDRKYYFENMRQKCFKDYYEKCEMPLILIMKSNLSK